MPRIDLGSVSVVLSLKADSAVRIENLRCVLHFYTYFGRDAEILVVEQSTTGGTDLGTGNVRHCILPDPGCHWKTRNLNYGARMSMRPVLIMTDCDMVPHPEALAKGIARVGTGTDIVHLFDGLVVNLSRRLLAEAADWTELLPRLRHFEPAVGFSRKELPDADQTPLYGDAGYRASGGCLACTREAFVASGGWNENIISYGFEDQEFDLRARRLGFSVARTEGYNLYHFDHPRGWDSRYSTFYRLNEAEFDRSAKMGRQALAAYAAAGFRSIRFEHDRDYVRTVTTCEDTWRAVTPARLDLSELVIVVVADSNIVPYGESCLQHFVDYLEVHFRSYDIRLCERSSYRGYRNIGNKLNLVYDSFPGDVSAADINNVIVASERRLSYVMRLTADAAAQLTRAVTIFDRVRSGCPLEAVFQSTEDKAGRRLQS